MQQPQRRKLRAAYRKAERLHQPKAEKELLRQKEEHQPPREDQQFYRQPSRLHQQKAEKELQWQKDKDHQPLREEQQCHTQPPAEIYRHPLYHRFVYSRSWPVSSILSPRAAYPMSRRWPV
ncbi:hypothetical protein KR200_004772 [Drosophila serrata]|nr:hypothetical protein KR200_004772 [Drosophila serrata]